MSKVYIIVYVNYVIACKHKLMKVNASHCKYKHKNVYASSVI